MPNKSTKTTEKAKLKDSKSSEKKSSSKKVEKEKVEKKSSTKKVVVKRRKVDLVPTKASAVAIVSQANRAKKQALIERVATSESIHKSETVSSDSKIPVWVWVFFGCSLLLFCVSFYQAIIRPQIEKENVVVNDSWIGEDLQNEGEYQEVEGDTENIPGNEELDQIESQEEQGVTVPETAVAVIGEFFIRLSNRNFDGAFDLMTPTLRGYPDIKNHFTSFRMDPFLDGIEGGRLKPVDIEYIKSPAYGKDIYTFNLSYVMKSNQEQYEETWEFGINTSGGEPKISSIRCVSSKCSYHPIFWPENFGLMR